MSLIVGYTFDWLKLTHQSNMFISSYERMSNTFSVIGFIAKSTVKFVNHT